MFACVSGRRQLDRSTVIVPRRCAIDPLVPPHRPAVSLTPRRQADPRHAAPSSIRAMAELTDAGVSELLAKPNHAVLSTINEDGSVHNTVVWLNVEDGKLAVQRGARGASAPANIARDPRVNLVVIDQENPYEYAEFKGQRGGGRRRRRAHRHARAEVHQPGEVPAGARRARCARSSTSARSACATPSGRSAAPPATLPSLRPEETQPRRADRGMSSSLLTPPEAAHRPLWADDGPRRARHALRGATARRPPVGLAAPSSRRRRPPLALLLVMCSLLGGGTTVGALAATGHLDADTTTVRQRHDHRHRGGPTDSTPRRCSRPLRPAWWTSPPAPPPAPAS